MKHYFIQQNYLPRLTLFFAGWGMDECPFMDYCSGNSDLLVCYDYRSLDFDFTLLQGYQEIRLIAWSMGVWAASMVLQDMDLPICESVALNGTVTPVDDLKGISQQVFEGTLEGLNEVTLEKFIRRMCLKKGESGNILVETSATCGRGTARRASEDWRTGKILRCSQFCMGTGCYRQE
ncbi:DUF452 family protein [Phocaeicola dorei]|nr:DUF452 family protein [Phocaeicola dorei]